MSAAKVCDQCEAVLVVDAKGDDPAGESAAWLKLTLSSKNYDLCTRACGVAFLQRPDVVESHDEHLAVVAEVARIIAEGQE